MLYQTRVTLGNNKCKLASIIWDLSFSVEKIYLQNYAELLLLTVMKILYYVFSIRSQNGAYYWMATNLKFSVMRRLLNLFCIFF
uniref:Uncharacterized protein n=1 Tax=Aegilops tauschii subsp. strangulata TaxID=200361 RepID=A0A453MR96_AEGTS